MTAPQETDAVMLAHVVRALRAERVPNPAFEWMQLVERLVVARSGRLFPQTLDDLAEALIVNLTTEASRLIIGHGVDVPAGLYNDVRAGTQQQPGERVRATDGDRPPAGFSAGGARIEDRAHESVQDGRVIGDVEGDRSVAQDCHSLAPSVGSEGSVERPVKPGVPSKRTAA